MQQEGTCELLLYGINGALILNDQLLLEDGQASYDFQDQTNLRSGVYFLKVIAPDKSSKTIKLIKN